jgi:GTP-binding protein
VGKPNAGKSTLISRLSGARPKIADYPFTTLHPCLGIVELRGFRRFVLADIPGLIEGAHAGAGLGDEFLRHIDRTRLLVHVLDLCPPGGDAVADYRGIRRELEQHSPSLAAKPELVAANKMDLTDARENLRRLRREIDAEILPISAVTGEGLERLTEAVWRALGEEHDQAASG